MTLNKRGAILIAGGLVILLVVAVTWLLPRRNAATTDGSVGRVVVRRGTLVVTVSATGAVGPRRQAELAFGTSGPLTQLHVSQGETVTSGQLLAQVDPRALDAQLAQAEANLAAALAKLDQLKHPATAEVTAAQSALGSAEAALVQLKLPAPNDITIAKADVDKAQAALDRAQADYDRAGGTSNPLIAMSSQSVTLQQASTDYRRALAAYDSKINPTGSQVKQAQSTVDQARATLAKLTDPDPNDLLAAQASVDQARAARDLAATQRETAILRAPFAGMVTHVDLELGSYVTASRVLLGVADVSEQRVKLNIDETDITRVRIGQDVSIGLDANPDVTLPARVTDVAAAATTTQGVVNYVVTVTLDPSETPLKIGMTANANIIVGQKENVLLLPNSAIRAVNSKRLVTLAEPDGTTREVQIQTGSANDQDTEIVSGLTEGQPVLISTAPFNPMTGSFGGSK